MITVEELEKRRKNVKHLLILNISLVVVTAPFWPSIFSIVMLVISGIFFLAVVMKKITDYKRFFKENIVKASLEGIFDELSYEPDQGFSSEEVELSGLIKLRDEFTSNDLIVAKYGKVKFKQADIIISERRHMGGSDNVLSTTTITCFVGRLLVFDFQKVTTAEVMVLGKNFSPSGNDQWLIGSLFNNLVNRNKQVLIESGEFNKGFNVYTGDPETAFYILTPPVLEAISNLSDHYGGKIGLCFRDKKMYVAINSKSDSLEARLISNRTVLQERELVLKEVKIITDFINLMSLEKNVLVTTNEVILF